MAELIDLGVLDKLTSEIGAENISMIVTMYCDDALARADSIDVAIIEKDVETIAQQCHAMKGGSLSVGAMVLGRYLQAAESAAKDGDIEAAIANLENYRPMLTDTVTQLKAYTP